MENSAVTRNIWRNSISNYITIFLRMGLGILMFRMLFQHFSAEEFGFWALLWSVFGYGILLDFGFGFTAMKRVAELSTQERWQDLNSLLSTVFFAFVIIGFAICALGFFGSQLLIDVFRITPENRESFRKLLILFVCGMGIGFPLGIFSEVLIGLQCISLVNRTFTLGFVVNFFLIAFGIHQGWGLRWCMAISLLGVLVPGIINVCYAFRKLPHLRIRPGLFSLAVVRGNVGFSVFAYINTLCNLLLYRTDQLVLSTTLAVSAVATYQAGAKISEMFAGFAQQLPETFSPAAAHLNAKGDKEFLRKLLINGTRISVMIGTPVYLIAAFYLEGFLKIVTGVKTPPSETFWVGQAMLFWAYTSLLTQSVARRIFIVCGHERKLMWLSVGEASLNLCLSVILVFIFHSALSVAVGSLVASLLFGWMFLWPWAARESNLGGWALAKVVLTPAILACTPMLVFILLARVFPLLDFRGSTHVFLLHCVLASALGAIGLWRFGLIKGERETLLLKASRLFAR